MNRRDVIVRGGILSAAIVTKATVPASTEGPRVVWVAFCRMIFQSPDTSLPDPIEYARDQERRGRRVVQVLESGHDLTKVVVEQPFGSMAEALQFVNDYNAKVIEGDHDPVGCGSVESIVALGSGQVIDVLALARLQSESSIRSLSRRITRLEQKDQVGEVDVSLPPDEVAAATEARDDSGE